jgi:hypothetical protein
LRTFGALWVVLAVSATASQAPAQNLVISEVLFDPVGVNTGNQIVEVCNLSENPIDLRESNIWLRFPPASWRFPEGAVLPAGGRAVVRVNRSGQSGVGVYFTGIAGMRSLRSSDSVALYRTNLFQDPDRLLHYVQWGAAAQGGENVASMADLWPQGEFVDSSSLRPGSSLANTLDAEGDPIPGADGAIAVWCVDGSPSPGLENDECTPSFASSGIVMNEVGLFSPDATGASFVELVNLGSVLEDLGAISVTLDGSESYRFSSGTLIGPGEIVVLRFGVDGVDTESVKHTGADTFRSLTRDDSCSIHLGEDLADPTRVLAFVQWGAGDSSVAEAAQAAGLWTEGGAVDNAGLHAQGGLVFEGGQIGPDGWGIDNTPTPGAPNDALTAPPTIVINEVLLDPEGENAGQHAVELHNLSEAGPADVSGMTLCVASAGDVETSTCFSLPAGSTISPQGYLVVRLNAVGDDTATDLFTGALVDLDLEGGEISLFLTSDVDDTNNLIDFLVWGSGNGPHRAAAEAVGVWPADESVSVVALQDGSSLSYLGDGDGADSFRIDQTPSIGEFNEEEAGRQPFRRGDCNDDGGVDISDSVATFNFLFLGDEPPLCINACDANRDNSTDISDAVFLLNFLFRGASPPPFPGPDGPCARVFGFGVPLCNAYISCEP